MERLYKYFVLICEQGHLGKITAGVRVSLGGVGPDNDVVRYIADIADSKQCTEETFCTGIVKYWKGSIEEYREDLIMYIAWRNASIAKVQVMEAWHVVLEAFAVGSVLGVRVDKLGSNSPTVVGTHESVQLTVITHDGNAFGHVMAALELRRVDYWVRLIDCNECKVDTEVIRIASTLKEE